MHLSFVRSVDMDQWKKSEVMLMKKGGNRRAKEFFKEHGWAEERSALDLIQKKYTSSASKMYRAKLQKAVESYMLSPPTSPVAQPVKQVGDGMDQLLISSAVGAKNMANNDVLSGAATLDDMEDRKSKKPVRLGRAVSSDGVKLVTNKSSAAGASTSSSTTKKSSVLTAKKKSKFKRRGKLGAKKTTAKISTSPIKENDMEANLKAQQAEAATAAANNTNSGTKDKKSSGSRYMATPRDTGRSNTSSSSMSSAPSSMDRTGSSSSSSLGSGGSNGGSNGGSGGFGMGGGGLSMDINRKKDQPRPKPATERFKNNKGISSDMYFDLNKEGDSMSTSDRKHNQQKFSGSAAISSE